MKGPATPPKSASYQILTAERTSSVTMVRVAFYSYYKRNEIHHHHLYLGFGLLRQHLTEEAQMWLILFQLF